MTPGPTAQDETANKTDDPAGDGVQADHAGQQEREHHQGCAALPVAVSAGDHNLGDPDEHRNAEEHAAGLREPEPVAEPPPVASETGHG
jgi:hypothetical protein